MIAYPQSGSFVRYLIKAYGLKKFKQAYKKLLRDKKNQQNIKIIKGFYSQSIKELEKSWIEYLTRL